MFNLRLGATLSMLVMAVPTGVGSIEALAATPDADAWVCPPCRGDCDTLHFSEAGNCSGCGMPLIRLRDILQVALVLWDGAELLDFAGPGEVFSAAGSFAAEEGRSTRIYTVASRPGNVVSQGFVTIVPEYTIADCPDPDIIVLPGGGVRNATDDTAMMRWITQVVSTADYAMSVCTGAFVLGKAGALDGLHATTWYGAIDDFRRAFPNTTVRDSVRFVDNGRIITTEGVSAGIDGALHLVARIFGDDVAALTARYMQYDRWDPEAGLVRVAPGN